jgi:hypothetical protein
VCQGRGVPVNQAAPAHEPALFENTNLGKMSGRKPAAEPPSERKSELSHRGIYILTSKSFKPKDLSRNFLLTP